MGRPHKLKDLLGRLVTKTKLAPGGCWLWTAGTNGNGYGLLGHTGSGSRLAHRMAYRLLRGVIPEGLEIDHLCRNRACVNPAHLEPVTHHENLLRGEVAQKTHCLRGHPLSGDNLVRRTGPAGHRKCLTCKRARERQAYRDDPELRTYRREYHRRWREAAR